MKTLSILQPWASLVMLELKRFETRSWSTNYRGPILIHSSAREHKEGRRLWEDVVVPNMPPKPCVASMPIRFDDLPFGHVLCRANLVDVIPTQAVLREITIHEKIFGDYTPGRFAWRLEDVTRLDPQLPAKGSLGLWEFELPEGIKTDPIVDALREKLRTRSEVGLRKYGVGLDRTDLTHLDWLRHHQEELIDAALYVERQIQDLEEGAR